MYPTPDRKAATAGACNVVSVQWANCHNVWFVLHRGVPVCAAAYTQK